MDNEVLGKVAMAEEVKEHRGFGVVKEKKVASVSEQGKHTWEIILV